MKKTSKKTSKTQKNKLPIIHILAASGSGKTTLGQKLKEYSDKFAVIELDDIDDPIALKMLNNPKYSKLALSKKEKDNNEYFDIKDKKGLIAINKLIKKYQKENKIVVNVCGSGNTGTWKPYVKKYPECSCDALGFTAN